MHSKLKQNQDKSLLDDKAIYNKLKFNYTKNIQQDHTAKIDEATNRFDYEQCKDAYWNPENLSLLYATPIWYQATARQKTILNQLYWVAYYSQIISAEVATIYYNQIASTGLYALEDFRLVCDTLDLESSQERAHINAFKTIGEEVEYQLLGERLFTYPMRGPFDHTMIFADRNKFIDYWRKLQLKAYSYIAPENAFLASQYLLIRGIRTLNGKLIQHKLAKNVMMLKDKTTSPIPALINYYHFMDESFHFNTSKLVGIDLLQSLNPPSAFEKWIMNKAIMGCQNDHYHFSVVVNGLFWYEPALFPTIYKLLRSRIFELNHQESLALMFQTFCVENEAQHLSAKLHQVANASYQAMVEPIGYLNATNRHMSIMKKNSIEKYLKQNKQQFKKFKKNETLHNHLCRQPQSATVFN